MNFGRENSDFETIFVAGAQCLFIALRSYVPDAIFSPAEYFRMLCNPLRAYFHFIFLQKISMTSKVVFRLGKGPEKLLT